MHVRIDSDDERLVRKHEAAIAGVLGNIRSEVALADRVVPKRMLFDGDSCYVGAWLEVCPLTSLVYGQYFDPALAQSGHEVFIETRDARGLLPFAIFRDRPCFGHVQEILPFAKTALETFRLTDDESFLHAAYQACREQDMWLGKYRDSRNLGLVECFCEFDTGHDNSNRFLRFNAGMARTCPPAEPGLLPPEVRERIRTDLETQIIHGDARILARTGSLPWLAPDLSATRYGNRMALSEIASILGRVQESAEWAEAAERTRVSILTYLYDPETRCFYDLDANDRFIRIVTDAITKVLCERVVDRTLGDAIFERHVLGPGGFWTPWPMATVAAGDPLFSLTTHPDNCWSGFVQPLAGLRTGRYFGHYRRWSEHALLLRRQLDAILRADGFRQQIHPFTGTCSGEDARYTPAMVAVIDHAARLHGVRTEGPNLEWTCSLPPEAHRLRYENDSGRSIAVMEHVRGTFDGAGHSSTLSLDSRTICTLTGECRLVTDHTGNPECLVGVSSRPETIELRDPAGSLRWKGVLAPNGTVDLQHA